MTVAVIVVGCVGILAWWMFAPNDSGDPGGRVLAQLTPVISALPENAASSYVWKMEPHQDSCDGMAGTFGWSEVVVQSGFQWKGTSQDLAHSLSQRLFRLGWRTGAPVGIPVGQPEFAWSKTLTNGTEATLTVGRAANGSPWQLTAVAPPVGRAAGGC